MDTLGIVESRSIAAGVELADIMMKGADVELVRASTICSGRYMIFVSGNRASVQTSVELARESNRSLAGSFILSNVSEQVMVALKKASMAEEGAIGIIECRKASFGVAAADCAVKQASVNIIRLVTGQGINGKSYFVINGDIASVTEATDAAKKMLGKSLIDAVVLPSPNDSVLKAITNRNL